MVSCTAICYRNGVENHIPLHSHNPEEQTIMRMCRDRYESLCGRRKIWEKFSQFCDSMIGSHINRYLVYFIFRRGTIYLVFYVLFLFLFDL